MSLADAFPHASMVALPAQHGSEATLPAYARAGGPA
jgi:hypothetical protein